MVDTNNKIMFKRSKTIHFKNYNEDLFFRDNESFDKNDYNIEDVAKTMGIKVLYSDPSTFLESKLTKIEPAYGVIEINSKNDIKIIISNEHAIYSYDIINASIETIICQLLNEDIEKYEGCKILINRNLMFIKPFFRKNYIPQKNNYHKVNPYHNEEKKMPDFNIKLSFLSDKQKKVLKYALICTTSFIFGCVLTAVTYDFLTNLIL